MESSFSGRLPWSAHGGIRSWVEAITTPLTHKVDYMSNLSEIGVHGGNPQSPEAIITHKADYVIFRRTPPYLVLMKIDLPVRGAPSHDDRLCQVLQDPPPGNCAVRG